MSLKSSTFVQGILIGHSNQNLKMDKVPTQSDEIPRDFDYAMKTISNIRSG